MNRVFLAHTLDGFLSRITPILKAINPEDLPTHEVADKAVPRWIKDFLDVVKETQGKIVLARIEAAFATGNLETVMKTIPWETMETGLSERWRVAIEKLVAQGATASSGSLPPPPVTGLSVRFDVTNPRAVEWVDRHAADLVTRVSAESRTAIKETIQRAFTDGKHPYESARIIKERIGLLPKHARAVEKFEARERHNLLEKNPKMSFEEASAKARGKAAKYAAKLLKYRAENIARTETLTASNRGQLELWQQAVEQGFLPKHVRRKWLLTDDDRLCSTCAEMAGATAGLDEVFTGPVSEEGKVLAGDCETPPLHPSCRCSMRLVIE